MNHLLQKAGYAIFLLVILSGCSTTDRAVFVTKSSISVLEVGSTPPSVSFGYDRTEGFFGPNYENGAVPSVVSIIQTDGKIRNPKIKQTYATGEAAEIVVDPKITTYTAKVADELVGERKALLFGTSTSFGFKVGITESNPTFTLGYKRMEMSIIPMRNAKGATTETYSSVLASIDTRLSNSDGWNFENGQYFATGVAAKKLATQQYIKNAFKENAKNALASFDRAVLEQVKYHSEIVRCTLSGLKKAQWKAAIDSGKASKIFGALDDDINNAYKQYTTSDEGDDKLKLIRYYSEGIQGGINAQSNEHTVLLKHHAKLVCDYAEENRSSSS